jgi:hypothetical protein
VLYKNNPEEFKCRELHWLLAEWVGWARLFASSWRHLGYKVVTTYSPGNAKVQDWLKAMNNMGYGFKAYPCDVTDFESARDLCIEP